MGHLFVCDFCGAKLETRYDEGQGASREAKSLGWVKRQTGMDVCPKCVENQRRAGKFRPVVGSSYLHDTNHLRLKVLNNVHRHGKRWSLCSAEATEHTPPAFLKTYAGNQVLVRHETLCTDCVPVEGGG